MRRFLLVAFCYALALTAQTSKESCPETPRLSPMSGEIEYVDCHGAIRKADAKPAASAVKHDGADSLVHPGDLADPEIQKAYKDLIRANLAYNAETYRHNADLYRWQHTSSIIIFWMVIVLVMSGLVLAATQFYIAMQAQIAHVKLPQKAETTFEASFKGLKISSSVIGLMILAMSMAFFVVYLKLVYPIHGGSEPALSQQR